MSAHDSKILAQLESRIEVADGLAKFRFVLERDFSFAPGQYATLWLTHRGETIARPYSIVSSPSESRVLEFYINLVSEGKLTASLWQKDVIEGLENRDRETRAEITGPKGRFVLDPEDLRDFVFVSSGTGIAPFVSMVRKLNEDFLASPKYFIPRRIYLIHGVSFPSHLGYRDEMEALAAETIRDPARKLRLLYIPTISRPFMDSKWTGLKGRAETLFDTNSVEVVPQKQNLEDIVKGMLAMLLRPQTHAVYVCGHPGTIDKMVVFLSKRGFHVGTDIKRERYYPLRITNDALRMKTDASQVIRDS
jgi:ferredoxin-NADP reductase